MTVNEINNKLKIVKLGDKKFRHPEGYMMPKGFAFYCEGKGFLALEAGILPYILMKKKYLQEILNDGGFTNFDNTVWLNEMN